MLTPESDGSWEDEEKGSPGEPAERCSHPDLALS